MNTNELRTLLNSARINFLIGSGASRDFLPTLNDVEEKIDTALDSGDDAALISAYREYFNGVMTPNKRLLANQLGKKELESSKQTLESYEKFFRTISMILLDRGSSIIGKQANIFTTNIDVLMELTLEKLGIDYCDGFTGNIRPTFNVSNFKRSVMQRSLQFENVTEIPLFNLVKLHGSLTWKEEVAGEISYQDCSQLFEDSDSDETFKELYEKLQIVNPGASKYSDTVLTQTFFDLLRTFSTELEKENAALFVIGFSLQDQHVKQIILRAADSNPTLKVVIFCHSEGTASRIMPLIKPDERRYKNIHLLIPEGEVENFNLDSITTFFDESGNNRPKQDDAEVAVV